jgi:membrane peptidoglycan carboxypeptidase
MRVGLTMQAWRERLPALRCRIGQGPVPDRPRRPRALALGALAAAVASGLVAAEVNSSTLQAAVFSRWARMMTFEVTAGPSPRIRFPTHGPYDSRLGYTRIPAFVERLTHRGYKVTRQAHASAAMAAFQRAGGFPPYREKTAAALRLQDYRSHHYFAARTEAGRYTDFASVPRLVVDALLFIENRELLDPTPLRRNPAVEWDRLGRAIVTRATGGLIGGSAPGGSTLATQLEKMRHSPDGRTTGANEKLRQMVSASLRAYRLGPDTRAARKQIVVDALNSAPLAGVAGHGEVIGIREGLELWFGADFLRANAILHFAGRGPIGLPETGLALKQVLSLLIAQRRPAHYLGAGRKDLEALADGHLRIMIRQGLIDPRLGQAAVNARLRFAARPTATGARLPMSAKAANATRFELMRLLGVPSLYQLDRLDLAAEASLDAEVQARVTEKLRSLADPEAVKAMGLGGYRLLGGSDPTKVAYSFTLFERGATASHPRIQTDSLDQPLDLNAGTKLELGSTAKVRTVLTYLEIVADLHDVYRTLSPFDLARVEATSDPLRRWVAGQLLDDPRLDTAGIVRAAMQKRYSAGSGERFFTAGGAHRFANFNRRHGGRMPVEDALRQSVNLVFIRMMRDIVDYHVGTIRRSRGDVVGDVRHPLRPVYLRRFADVEGRQYLERFHNDYRGLPRHAILDRIAARARYMRPRLAAAYRTVLPRLTYEGFAYLVDRHAAHKPNGPEAMRELYDTYSPARLSLADRSYVSSIHPLELWLAGHLYRNPGASWSEIVAASADVRQESYGWLFKSNRIAAQNRRIRTLLEQEAFAPIERQWRRLGYPFERLVPSYATAIGVSGDRPDALAELMGIIVNDGVRLPIVRVERLRFAEGTPYETIVEAAPPPVRRVLRPEIAAAMRKALVDTVESGTAKRASAAFIEANGGTLVVGGKTGTGDNRTDRYGKGRRLIGSEVRSRTASFVFFIGDRWYGTITAHVVGPDAARYRFTSALPTQLFKSLAPTLQPLVSRPPAALPPSGTTTLQPLHSG